MAALDNCTLVEIDIRWKRGTKRISAHLLGHLACHRVPDRPSFDITHVPTGLRMPCTFASAFDAAEAMAEINMLRDWSAVDGDSLHMELYRRVVDISEMHGGWLVRSSKVAREARAERGPLQDMNGYGARQ